MLLPLKTGRVYRAYGYGLCVFLMLSVVSFREFTLPAPFGMPKGPGGPGALWPWPLMLEGTTVETSVVEGFDVGEGLQGKDAMRWISR